MWMYLGTSIAVILLFQLDSLKNLLPGKGSFAEEFSAISTWKANLSKSTCPT